MKKATITNVSNNHLNEYIYLLDVLLLTIEHKFSHVELLPTSIVERLKKEQDKARNEDEKRTWFDENVMPKIIS